MKIFVTGATGFVGSRLVPRLVERGHKLTCIMRSPEKQEHLNGFADCRIIKGDVRDRDSLRGKMTGMDLIVHLAVATPLRTDPERWEPFYQTNVLGTRHILEECVVSGPNKILCFSSTAAIGRPRVRMIDENTPLRPVSYYGISKKQADETVSEFIRVHGLPVTTILFPHIYGPGDTHDFLKIVKMIQRGILPQVGYSPNLLPMVYWSDAIDAVLLAIERGRPGEKYIVADDDPHDLKVIRRLVLKYLGINRRFYPFIPKSLGIWGASFLEILFGLFGRTPPIRAENIQSITAGRRLSIRKAERELLFSPEINLEEGIKRTIEWYKKEGII